MQLVRIITALSFTSLLAPALDAQTWTEYSASSGSLPEANSWVFFDDTPGQPTPTVSGGLLHQGPTGSGCDENYQFWERYDVPFDLTESFVIEVEIQILEANYVPTSQCNDYPCGGQTAWAPGYIIDVIDKFARRFSLGLTSAGVVLDPELRYCADIAPHLPFVTTDAQHLYRVEVESNIIRLFIDGELFHSIDMGTSVVPGYENRILFGDGGHLSSSQSELKSLRYSATLPGVRYCFGDGSGGACPCANDSHSAEGCLNSSTLGGLLSISGSQSVAEDDMAFQASKLPSGVPTLLFSGETTLGSAGAISFGDGLRCAGGPLRRLAVTTANAGGHADWGPGLADQAAWTAGMTRHLQAWYRDPAGPCGAGFNLTNAIEVTLAP